MKEEGFFNRFAYTWVGVIFLSYGFYWFGLYVYMVRFPFPIASFVIELLVSLPNLVIAPWTSWCWRLLTVCGYTDSRLSYEIHDLDASHAGSHDGHGL